MAYLQPITRFSAADNLGGIVEIQVARKADITAIPQPVNGVIYGNITFAPGKAFVTWEVTTESAGINSKGNLTKEGFTKDNRLPFRVPKLRGIITNMLNAATEDEFIVLVKDGNGTNWMLGQLDSPALFELDKNTGTAHADHNHYACAFTYKGPDNIFEYQGAIEVAPAGPPPAIVKFGSTVGNAVPIASLAPGETLTILSDYSYNEYFTTQ